MHRLLIPLLLLACGAMHAAPAVDDEPPAAAPSRRGKAATGIVVNRSGEVFFSDTAAGVWKFSPSGAGQLILMESKAHNGLALDVEGQFINSTRDQFYRVTPKDVVPALLAGRKHPVAMADDGYLYYASSQLNGHLMIMRLKPNGETFVVADIPDNPKQKKLRGVNGMAAGPANSLYVAGNHTVRRISQQGTVTNVAGPLNMPECAAVAGVKKGWRPFLQGLTVTGDETVYVAATGCNAVFRVAKDGIVSTVHKTENPWTPTGVAIHRGDLYVLEYPYSSSKKAKDWTPRVEVIRSDGSISVLATAKH